MPRSSDVRSASISVTEKQRDAINNLVIKQITETGQRSNQINAIQELLETYQKAHGVDLSTPPGKEKAS